MLNLYTLAVKPQALSELLNLRFHASYTPFYQARPGMYLPIIISTAPGKKTTPPQATLINAHWGCQTEAATMLLHAYPMEKILTQPPFNRWIHSQRCLIPANCFFGRNRNAARMPEDHDTYLIRLLRSRLFLIGGLYTVERDAHRADIYTFLLLKTQSADILKPLMEEMPVVLMPDHLNTWLSSDHLVDIMHLADRAGDHWFDYFAVSSQILTPGTNSRNLLKPLGLSLREYEERDHKLKAIDVKQDRFDRRGSKW